MNKPKRIPRTRAYKRPQLTRFIVCRHQQGCWIASEKHGQVTGLFSIDIAIDIVAAEGPRKEPPRQ
jgi:hypothetical protein